MMRSSIALLILAAVLALNTSTADAQKEIAPFKRRIVGGETADIKQHPWQVALQLKVAGTTRLCGGSVIAAQWVLTAAHCFDNNAREPRARAGSTNYAAPGPWLQAERTVVHEGYVAETFENDIALVKLKSSSLTAGGRVIPRAAPSVTVPTGQPLEVTGWGAIKEGGSGSSMLMKATVPLVDTATCNAQDSYAGKVKDSMMCAGAKDGGIDSCQGDSGGPLVWRTSEGPVLVGVVSHGEGCARKLKYGVYTRVGAYRDWIDRVLASDQR